MQIHNIEDSSFGELWQEFRRISEQKSIGQGEMDMLNIIEAELLKRGRVADVAIKYEKENPVDLNRDFEEREGGGDSPAIED